MNWIGSLFHDDLISGNVDKQILYNSVISSAIICITISAVYVLGWLGLGFYENLLLEYWLGL